jgi:DnaJ-domain-containing protein 1
MTAPEQYAAAAARHDLADAFLRAAVRAALEQGVRPAAVQEITESEIRATTGEMLARSVAAS